jgi:ketosteroid isomerase-like protein
VEEVDRVINDYHLALDRFFKGDPEPAKQLYSHRDDVCLNNPFGPPACGWTQVARIMEYAAASYRDGRATSFDRVAEYTSGELACVVEVEHYEAKVGGSEDITPIALRVTTILRPEDGGWKIVHRHADPITAARSPESVIQR